MVTRRTSLFVGVMALATTVAMATEAPRAMLYPSGNVSVNGSAVDHSAAVYDGDVIVTKSNSAVSLANSGSSVVLPANSSLTYRNGTVNIASGSAAIKTTNGMSARVGEMTIAPANSAAQYRVASNGNSVQIDSVQGRVSVSNGAKNLAIEPGKSLTLPLMARNVDPNPAPQGGGGAGGAGAGAGSGSGVAVGLVVGIAATVAAAIAGAIAVTSNPAASPTTP